MRVCSRLWGPPTASAPWKRRKGCWRCTRRVPSPSLRCGRAGLQVEVDDHAEAALRHAHGRRRRPRLALRGGGVEAVRQQAGEQDLRRPRNVPSQAPSPTSEFSD